MGGVALVGLTSFFRCGLGPNSVAGLFQVDFFVACFALILWYRGDYLGDPASFESPKTAVGV